MRAVKGFESYTLARSSSGEAGMSMTVCQDKAGTEESGRVAKEWVTKNAGNISVDAPKVSQGSIIIHATKHSLVVADPGRAPNRPGFRFWFFSCRAGPI